MTLLILIRRRRSSSLTVRAQRVVLRLLDPVQQPILWPEHFDVAILLDNGRTDHHQETTSIRLRTLISARMIMMTAPSDARVECCCAGLSQRGRLELQGYSEKAERIHGDY